MNANDVLSARAILQGQLVARQRGPDKKLVELQNALNQARQAENAASVAFEAAKVPSRNFSVEKRHRAEEAWLRATALAGEALAALDAHKQTLPSGTESTRSAQIAQREILIEEALELVDNLSADLRGLMDSVRALKALHQYFVGKFNATNDREYAVAAERVMTAVIAATSIGLQQYLFGLVPHDELQSTRQQVEIFAQKILQKPMARLMETIAP